jgi:hypothetical protein
MGQSKIKKGFKHLSIRDRTAEFLFFLFLRR